MDTDHDGVPNEPGEPYIDPYALNVGLSFYPVTGTPPEGAENYAAIYEPLPAGRHGRIIILTDAPRFNYFIDRESLNPYLDYEVVHSLSGVTNQEDSQGLSRSTTVNTFRGITQHHFDGYLEAYPDYTGIDSTPWPAPQNDDPVPITTLNP